jgi:hypothetical protein
MVSHALQCHCVVLEDHRVWISISLCSLGTDLKENRSIAQQRMFYCCQAPLSGQLFTACCITSTARTHREHCFCCCVFVATCLLRRCIANGSVIVDDYKPMAEFEVITAGKVFTNSVHCNLDNRWNGLGEIVLRYKGVKWLHIIRI